MNSGVSIYSASCACYLDQVSKVIWAFTRLAACWLKKLIARLPGDRLVAGAIDNVGQDGSACCGFLCSAAIPVALAGGGWWWIAVAKRDPAK
jgi:hypothetical protein